MTDDGRQNPKIPQRAQSLATLIHVLTLTSAEIPEKTGLSLRKTSKLLYKKLSGLPGHREPGQDLSGLLNEVRALASGILTELSSPVTSSSFPKKEHAYLVSSYERLLNSLQLPIGSVDAKPVQPHQGLAMEDWDSADRNSSQSLRGKVILITRPLSQSQSSVRMVERYGGLPVVIPMIEISDPDDWYPVDRSIVNLKGYDGVIFTSQNGVDRFLGRIPSVNATALKILATRRVYAVGEKTRTSLENAQIPVTLMPERFSAKDLVSALQKEPLAGKRFLFPKGSLAKEEIPEALRASDAVVDEIEVYKTVGATGTSFVALNLALKNDEIDALAFFSPSAVQSFTHVVDSERLSKPVVACIGSSTAEAAASARFERIITAPEATAESLIGALVRYFDQYYYS